MTRADVASPCESFKDDIHAALPCDQTTLTEFQCICPEVVRIISTLDRGFSQSRTMASFLDRFKRRSREDEVAPSHTDASATKASNTFDQAGNEKNMPATTDSERLQDPKKQPDELRTSGNSPVDDGEDDTDLPEDLRELPKIVRSIVSLEDDANAPTITFRYFLLCFIFVPPGAILFQMGIFRTTASAYPVLFVQIGKLIISACL